MSLDKTRAFVHKYFVLFVLLCYALATFSPALGVALRNISIGSLIWFDESSVNISMPFLMLFFLLFNAGLGVRTKELKLLKNHWEILLIAYASILILPLVLIFLVFLFMSFWHNPDESQNILGGLAILASMPIASSSAAWSQNSDGNMALSLGLVMLSTSLSFLTTPLILHFVGYLTTGDYSEDLHELALNGTGAFIVFSIIVPCFLGMLFHYLIGERRVSKIKPSLKFINQFILLILIYSNAATTLPEAFGKPDWDFLIVIVFITLSICAILFLSGLVISKLFKAAKPELSSITFALGMRNNGSGLVLASMYLADHPLMMLPLIFYNLFQQIMASLLGFLNGKSHINT